MAVMQVGLTVDAGKPDVTASPHNANARRRHGASNSQNGPAIAKAIHNRD